MPFQVIPLPGRSIPLSLVRQREEAIVRNLQAQIDARNRAYFQTPEILSNPVADIQKFLTDRSVWFNVIGVIVGLILIILALNVILRHGV